MGLEQFAVATDFKPERWVDFRVPKHKPIDTINSSSSAAYRKVYLYHWRNEQDLHAWMRRMYQDKGGGSDPFQLSPVVLDDDDLDALECFVDQSEALDLSMFIAKARTAIKKGLTVYYFAW